MPYQELDGITSADIAFEAWDSTLEGCMREAVEALMHVMVVDMNQIGQEVERSFEIESEEPTLEAAAPDLMYQLLQKFVYFKDADQILLRVLRKEDLVLSDRPNPTSAFRLKVKAFGSQINPETQDLRTDVKGVTFHRFHVEKRSDGWHALVVVDT